MASCLSLYSLSSCNQSEQESLLLVAHSLRASHASISSSVLSCSLYNQGLIYARQISGQLENEARWFWGKAFHCLKAKLGKFHFNMMRRHLLLYTLIIVASIMSPGPDTLWLVVRQCTYKDMLFSYKYMIMYSLHVAWDSKFSLVLCGVQLRLIIYCSV